MSQTGRQRTGRSWPLTAVGLATVALLVSACSGDAWPTAQRPTPSRATAPTTAAPPTGPTTVAPPSVAPAALVWLPCEAGFECARLRVDVPGGTGTTELAVTRHRASGERVGALVYNPGGPGASAVDSLQRSVGAFTAVLRERFDLVAFDPRGVGRSTPVRCGTTADLDRYWALDPSPDSPAELSAYEQGTASLVTGCAQRSAEQLRYVSTDQVAADLESLRVALGGEPLTYLGYSYGTSIGAAYLDAFPTHVRAMVLDGALDPALSWDGLLQGQSRGFDRALAALLTDCERTRCAFRRAVTGNLTAAYDALAARIDAHPLPAAPGRALGPGEFTLAVGAGLYNRRYGWPQLAAALAAAQQGDGRALLALSDAYLQRDATGYTPLLEANLAVTCLDRPWPRDMQAYLDLAARLARDAPRFGPAIALAALPCATWPVPPVSTPHPVRGVGAPPVVVVGTTGDPATPYAWAVALAGQLDRGVLLTHEGEGHTVYRSGAPRCLTGALDAYLVTGAPPTPLTC